MPIKDINLKRKYQREWLKARKDAYFAENGPCIKCGSNENLELDHIDPSKKTTHRIWSWSEARRLHELAKCQILCSSCHKEKTKKDLSKHFTNKPNYKARKYNKTLVLNVLNDYFNNGLSRRKVAEKYKIPQGTISRWLYTNTFKELVKSL